MSDMIDRRQFISRTAIVGAAAATLANAVAPKRAPAQDASALLWVEATDFDRFVLLAKRTSQKYESLTVGRLVSWLSRNGRTGKVYATPDASNFHRAFAVRYYLNGSAKRDIELGPLCLPEAAAQLKKPNRLRAAIRPFYEQFCVVQDTGPGNEADWMIDHPGVPGDSPLAVLFNFVRRMREDSDIQVRVRHQIFGTDGHTRTYLVVTTPNP